ncbi:sulfatase-like hydrolase/transferase, partial [Escherichia coli]
TNMVGCYSGKPLNTQNIDSLAAEGIRFNSAYTCSPVCSPGHPELSRPDRSKNQRISLNTPPDR